MAKTSLDLKLKILAGIFLASIVLMFVLPPIPQDAAYHRFADSRAIFGIPNFWNVATNLPFLIAGLLGLRSVSTGTPPGGLQERRAAYFVFFLGFALIGLGSGYYHLAPSNATLFWDRLPISISFMAFLSIIIGENIDRTSGKKLLWPLVAAGIATVLYWRITETAGTGDLRPYVLVQFLPMLLIPLILILFPSSLTRPGYIWLILGAYASAKAAELLDAELFRLAGLSGHSMKHIFAAAAAVLLLAALERRREIR